MEFKKALVVRNSYYLEGNKVLIKRHSGELKLKILEVRMGHMLCLNLEELTPIEIYYETIIEIHHY